MPCSLLCRVYKKTDYVFTIETHLCTVQCDWVWNVDNRQRRRNRTNKN